MDHKIVYGTSRDIMIITHIDAGYLDEYRLEIKLEVGYITIFKNEDFEVVKTQYDKYYNEALLGM